MQAGQSPQTWKALMAWMMEVPKSVLELVQLRFLEHGVDSPVPQAVEESSDVAHVIPQGSITKGIGELGPSSPGSWLQELLTENPRHIAIGVVSRYARSREYVEGILHQLEWSPQQEFPARET